MVKVTQPLRRQEGQGGKKKAECNLARAKVASLVGERDGQRRYRFLVPPIRLLSRRVRIRVRLERHEEEEERSRKLFYNSREERVERARARDPPFVHLSRCRCAVRAAIQPILRGLITQLILRLYQPPQYRITFTARRNRAFN